MKTSLMILLSVMSALALLEGCSKRPTLKAVKATRTLVETTITTISSGTVEADQQAVLGFSTTGRVARIPIRLGQKVRRGQVLAELENADLRIIYEDAERDASRSEQLFKEGLVSQAALDSARKNLEIARANLDKTLIKAPFDGVVSELGLEVGELSQLGSATTAANAKAPIRLIDLKPRLVRGQIDEVDIGKVRVGTPARVKVNAFAPRPLEGQVIRVVPFVKSNRDQDRTSEIEVKVETGGQDLLPVGASADVEMVIESRPGVLAVPTRAILGTSGKRYVYRYDGTRAVRTEVTRGAGNYDRTEISTGISEGDVVLYPSDDVELVDGLKVQAQMQSWP